MTRKIIVLGMDNSGKTTLVNKMRDLFGYDPVRSKGPNLSRAQMEVFAVEGMLLDGKKIFERFCIFEEMVYGSALRGESKFSLEDDVVKTILSQKPLIVYCRPKRSDITNFGEREQMRGVIPMAQDLINRWDRLAMQLKDLGFEVIFYDYNFMVPYDVEGRATR